jgi:AGCS family alanine or glycine:cation symporter
MGSALQAEAVVDVAEQTIAMRPIFTSLILAVLMLPCIIGGAEKIENITEFVIPLTTIIYITMCFCVIFTNLSDLPRVVSVIISEAISPSAILGGGVMVAIKEGFARGILSNEAGLGTSSLAHSRATARSPRVAGLFGILEVFFDTTLLCGLTGLVILLSVDDPSAYSSPMSLVRAAFSASLGAFSAFLLLLSIFLFAYSTVICWYFYGSRQTHGYVFIKASFIFLFLFFLFLPTFAAPSFLLYLTDLIILLMSIITLVSITKKKDRISDLSRENSM